MQTTLGLVATGLELVAASVGIGEVLRLLDVEVNQQPWAVNDDHAAIVHES